MSPYRIRLTTVIPTHRRNRSLMRLLASLSRQDLEPGCLEILVVGNLYDQKLFRQIRNLRDRLPELSYFYSGKIGVNRARNIGLRLARAGVVLFLDDDCEAADPSFLRRHLELHEANPRATACGGPYRLPPGASHTARAYHANAEIWLNLANRAGVRCLLGGNTSYKTGRLGRDFVFDEAIAFGGAETSLNSRLVAAGHELLFAASLGVTHHLRLGLMDFFRKAYLQGRETARRHAGGLDLDLARPDAESVRRALQHYAGGRLQKRLLPLLLRFYGRSFANGYGSWERA
jgi:glycosyltransferase involved in cell wall biosynthesis